ncbi:glycosyltransferase family 2 protein [Vibrio sp. SCSIO 43135]|uniref:glycosyltransferase family 2 protein n=1 Tax=Vibrio sp. SCSIO 43135 TaxID=2819096 RepID=UPI0020760870|nr:glycosyltransferase family 2 protein [Vibrio sp. SCSIO 43135]USD39955.1 glycosyltransferase family 2 protein [Vibrio sp. SCSIO 43135]
MIELMLIMVCVVSGLLIIYHHVGYPLLLKWYSRTHPITPCKNVLRGYRDIRADRVRPSITIVVPAYNEERWISDKIRNLASLDYPRSQLKIIIACDGCTDKTVEIAQDTIQEAICCDTHFEVLDFAENRGKVAMINHVMLSVSSDITALSDVSALISIDALLIAEQNFRNPKVGVVNSRYHLLESNNAGEAKYWHYQSQLKQNEASLGSTLGAHGALYFFRTHLFAPLPTNTINDDFILPMEIVKQGYQAAYESRMMAIELEATNESSDFKRRLRISAGNMQQAIRLASLFSPKYKGVAFAFISGKGLRLMMPYLMIICLVGSVVLMDNPLFFAALVAQIVIYALAMLGFLFPHIFNYKICRLITYLVAGHYANFIGGLRYLLGLESGRWTRVNR